MSDELVANFTLNNTSLNAQYEISEVEQIDATFKIYANATQWGNIQGDIADQTDLIDLIDTKIDIEATARENNDLLLQNGISTLNDDLTAEISNRGTADGILQGNIDTLSGTVSDNYTTLDGKIGDNKTSIDNHITDKTNPHEVTKAQVGLGNVDNTSDLNKPISTATQTALDDKQNTINDLSEIRLNASNGQSAYNTIKTFGDIVTYDASSFATNLQGQKADTALQPNDDISKLNNDAGYITSADVPTVNNSTITFQKNNITVGDINLNQANNETINFDIPTTASDVNALPDTTTINDLTTTAQQNAINSGATSNNIGQIATNTANLNSLQTTVTNNYNTLDNRITSEVSNLNSAISTEATNRQNADNNLQSQIDALVVASDVFDIVGTYAELQTYDISTVPVNDIIKVLVDSTHNNAATYYRCVENDNVKSWSYIGAEGAYYTKSEADGRFVEQTTTINGQALSNNITLTASDVGALPDSTTIGNGTLTIQKNGSTIDTFGANDTGNTTVNITVPTDTGDLTNNAGYIKDINRTDVTTALGYTPYDSTNPNGYTSNVGTVTKVNNTSPDSSGNVTLSIPAAQVNSDWNASSGVAQILNKPTLSTVATSGSYNDLSDKPTIPTVGNGTITINQGGVQKGTFTTNQSGNTTIDLDSGGSDIEVDDELSTTSENPVQNKVITGALNDKQDVILDLSTIRSGASAGSTAIQPNDLATVATSGSYNDLADKPTIPSAVTESTVSGWGFTKNTGTVTSVNNISPVNGNVSLTIPTVDQSFDGTSTNAESGVSILGLLQTIYPVGSVYLSTNATCPLASLFGTWTLVSSGRALWTGTGSDGDTTIPAGLPNITGSAWSPRLGYHDSNDASRVTGAFSTSNSNATASTNAGSGYNGIKISFDASDSNSIYGNSTTVQPPAYVVNVWRRTA